MDILNCIFTLALGNIPMTVGLLSSKGSVHGMILANSLSTTR